MNLVKAILLKIASALLFAVMSVLVRYLGDRYPVGQVVFFRSAFAILPVVIIYAWRGELEAAIRIGRPFGHLGRGADRGRRHVLQFLGAGAAAGGRCDRDLVRVAADHGRDVGALPQGARAHLSLVGGRSSDFSACW